MYLRTPPFFTMCLVGGGVSSLGKHHYFLRGFPGFGPTPPRNDPDLGGCAESQVQLVGDGREAGDGRRAKKDLS